MDNLTHSLAGACLGEAGLRRNTPYATTTLVLAANIPDLDVFAFLGGPDFQLGFRRGWTHGPLGLLVLPALLIVVMIAVHRLRARDRTPLDTRRLLLLAYLGALTHPTLDWLNTYGMRWLMPFSPRWTYGDALFIVDPWVWLALAFPVVLAWTRTRRGLTLWTSLGLAGTILILSTGLAAPAAQALWLGGAIGIALARWRLGTTSMPRAAMVALGAVCLYTTVMSVASVRVRHLATEWYAQRGVTVTDVMAGPVPMNPFARDVVGVSHSTYHIAAFSWVATPSLRETLAPIPHHDGPVARAARAAPGVQGFMSWARFPSYDVVPEDGGHLVQINDVRYARGGAGFGTAWVRLDADRQPVASGIGSR